MLDAICVCGNGLKHHVKGPNGSMYGGRNLTFGSKCTSFKFKGFTKSINSCQPVRISSTKV